MLAVELQSEKASYTTTVVWFLLQPGHDYALGVTRAVCLKGQGLGLAGSDSDSVGEQNSG